VKEFPWKQLLVAGVLLWAVIMVLPSINPDWWPHKTINLGLDLQGGMHLVLEVQTEKAVEAQVTSYADQLKSALRQDRIRHTNITVQGDRILVTARGQDSIKAMNAILKKDFDTLHTEIKTEKENMRELALSLPDKQAQEIKKMAVSQALETIRNRIDQFGVSEPSIRVQGKRQILVQLPGVTDTSRAKDLIGKTALLEFRLVDEEHDVSKALDGAVPAGSEILYQIRRDPETDQTTKNPVSDQKRDFTYRR